MKFLDHRSIQPARIGLRPFSANSRSGEASIKDFELFSTPEQQSYHVQFNYFIARQLNYVQRPVGDRILYEQTNGFAELKQIWDFVYASQASLAVPHFSLRNAKDDARWKDKLANGLERCRYEWHCRDFALAQNVH